MIGHGKQLCGVVTRNGLGCLSVWPVGQTLALVAAAFTASPARAEEQSAPPVSAATAPPVSPSPAGYKIAPEKPAPATIAKAAECACVPVPPPLLVFVENPRRLAEITKSDPLVSEQAYHLARREESSRRVAGAGVILGLGTLGIGATMRLHDGHWSAGSAAAFISSGVLTIAAVLVAWAMWPDRDDRLQVINAWNRRHPQDVLWP
jgi:hypothetical protein